MTLAGVTRAFYRPSGAVASVELAPAPLITLIAGPTASGKSRLALEMAERTGAVIINADSQQLYADLRVLSARPSHEDEAKVEHQLYGVADAAELWSVGRWVRATGSLLAGCRNDGRPALLVGGTGLYFQALTAGLADIPPVPLEKRTELESAYDSLGEVDFRRALSDVDPAAALRISPGDRQRLVRALGVAQHTGTALSDWIAETRPLLEPDSWTGWLISPDREALYMACDRRVAQMVRTGALEEVQALIERDLDARLPAMKAVGVREFAAYLTGHTRLETAIAATRQSTRNYAKRQMTWFRHRTPGWRCVGDSLHSAD